MTLQVRSISPVAPFLFLLLLTACADLSAIGADVCGNKVTERETNGEECDETSDFCHAPGTTNQCRFKCDATVDFADDDCPDGYRCGLDNVCRAPSGAFVFVQEVSATPTIGLATSDFDGDNRLDVLRESDTKSFIQFYGDDFDVASGASITRLPNNVRPMLTELNDDTLTDIGFSVDNPNSSGLVVYRAAPNGALENTLYSTVKIPVKPVEGRTAIAVTGNFVAPINREEILGLVAPYSNADPDVAQLIGIGGTTPSIIPTPPIDPFNLVAFTTGRVSGQYPCPQLVYAEGFQNRVHVLSPCTPSHLWATGATPLMETLLLPDPSFFLFDLDFLSFGGFREENQRSSVWTVDWNNDNLEDVVAFAIGDDNFPPFNNVELVIWEQAPTPMPPPASAFLPPVVRPYPPPSLPTGKCTVGAPLEVVDLNADGQLDFVTQHAIIVSQPTGDYEFADCHEDVAWAKTAVGDFDANGTLDIVATRNVAFIDEGFEFVGPPITGLDHRRGQGNGTFTQTLIGTKRPVTFVEAGDFDGDFVEDIVWGELDLEAFDDDENEAEDEVFVAFGATSGGFETPASLGMLRLVSQLVVGRFESADATDDIAILSRPSNTELAFAPVVGSGSRQLVSPFLFTLGDPGQEPVLTRIDAVVAGTFDATGGNSFTVVTTDSEGPPFNRVWKVDAEGEQVDLTCTLSDSFSGVVPGERFLCQSCVYAALDLDLDGIDELVSFGALLKENAVEFAFDTSIAVFEASDNGFTMRGAPVNVNNEFTFSAKHSAGPVNVPIVQDFDLDGDMDVMLLADTDVGFSLAPGEEAFFLHPRIVIFWNDGSGTINPGNKTVVGRPDTAVLSFVVVNVDFDPRPEIVVALDFFEEDYAGPDMGPPDPNMGPPPELADFRDEEIIVLNIEADGTVTPIEEALTLEVFGDPPDLDPDAVIAGDFDGDGVDDLLSGDFNGYVVLKGIPAQP